MAAQPKVDTASVVAAYLRFVALVGRVLTITGHDGAVTRTRDEADASAAFAGMAVVQAAARGAGVSASQRAAIDRALFTGALKPRFPGMERALPDPEFDEFAEGGFDDVLFELAKQELIGRLVYVRVEGTTRGQSFLERCGELAQAVTVALHAPGSSEWLENYRANLRRRFDTEPYSALGVGEGSDDD